jgi:CBS domain-containing protein/PII-like signaling protein
VAGLTYKVIEIYTSEQARWRGAPLYDAVVQVVARQKSAARCIVNRAVAGCFENGELASHRVLDLSHNMPLKIEIVLPSPELDPILEAIEKIVADGIVLVKECDRFLHHTTGGLLPRGLLVRDVMTTSPVSVGKNAPLGEVVSLLVRSEFDAVPVTDRRGRLAGMVTQDVLVEKAGMHVRPRLLAALWQDSDDTVAETELFDAESSRLEAGDLMLQGPTSIGPDDPLAGAVKLMTAGNLKRLPVTDPDGRLIGMLARIDILRVASTGSSRREVLKRYGAAVASTTPVRQADLLDVPTISPDTVADEVMRILDNEGQRVVVVDAERRPLGVISDRDLLPLLDPGRRDKARSLTAGSLMRNVPAINEDAGVEEALGWMVEHRRKRLPVVDGEGKYVGMLSREELLRMLAPETPG